MRALAARVPFEPAQSDGPCVRHARVKSSGVVGITTRAASILLSSEHCLGIWPGRPEVAANIRSSSGGRVERWRGGNHDRSCAPTPFWAGRADLRLKKDCYIAIVDLLKLLSRTLGYWCWSEHRNLGTHVMFGCAAAAAGATAAAAAAAVYTHSCSLPRTSVRASKASALDATLHERIGHYRSCANQLSVPMQYAEHTDKHTPLVAVRVSDSSASSATFHLLIFLLLLVLA